MISKIDKNISSDSSFHWFLINKIRLNNYRFILNIDNFLFSQKNSYPQLYHWLFSLIRPDKIFYYNKILKFLDDSNSCLKHSSCSSLPFMSTSTSFPKMYCAAISCKYCSLSSFILHLL